MKKPDATYLGDTYKFNWPDHGVEAVLERFNEDRREGLIAEITIRSSLGLLNQSRLNLSSTRSRSMLANELNKRVEDVDWRGLLEQTCYLSLQRWRDGDPIIDLATVEHRVGPHYLLEPFIEDQGVTLLFAKGGVGKSLLGLAMAATIATGWAILGRLPREVCPVLYLDWEADERAHAERLAAICAGVGQYEIPCGMIHYRHQVASMAESAATLRRLVAEHGIGFVVVDSMGAARGGDPESAETTIRMFTAARSLDVPVLGIDHLSKGALSGGDSSMPFGSVYSFNLCRLAWGVDHITEDEQGVTSTTTIAMRNTKSNNGRLHRQLAYDLVFQSETPDTPPLALEFRAKDPRDIPEAAPRLGQADQVFGALRRQGGSATVADLHADLESYAVKITEDNVRVVLHRQAKRGRVIQVGDKWALVAEREEPEA